MDALLTSLTFYFFSLNLQLISANKLTCGFPGTPAYGYVKPDRATYFEGELVLYFCRVGYILLGSPISRCTADGSWSEDAPICDDSMTTLGIASSTPTVPGHSADLAIDRDKNTCSYLKPKKPRWWRVDLKGKHKVLSVAVTVISPDKYMKFSVFIINIQETSASYKRCESFTGKFDTQTVVFSCAEGKGIEGQKIHIEDHLQEEIFEICEVEVQVEKDTGYDCGRPSRNLYSITYNPKNGKVEYGCIRGYEMKGKDYRHCLSTGQWSGDPPICVPILCDNLDDLEHGNVRITYDSDSPPMKEAVAIYKCNEGYKLEGPFKRNCLKDGSWSGEDPQCRAIRCPIPDGEDQGGVYRLVNKTNSMGSMAMLRCKDGKREGDNPYIICTEDGEWTKPEAYCILPSTDAYTSQEPPRIENQGERKTNKESSNTSFLYIATLFKCLIQFFRFGMVVAAVMIAVLNSNKPELPSRSIEPPVPIPRPPLRINKNVAFKSVFTRLISRDNDDNQEEPKVTYKDEPAVIQVEVLDNDDSGKKVEPLSSVPEQNEDTSPENVVLDIEDKSNKDSTPKEPRSAVTEPIHFLWMSSGGKRHFTLHLFRSMLLSANPKMKRRRKNLKHTVTKLREILNDKAKEKGERNAKEERIAKDEKKAEGEEKKKSEAPAGRE
ncbi:sushi, von Willebrand factor type A, EGF and pentraxin domain-containing protein 1-like [Argiope bruennichi]|uniref:sushi, von Willebrand factor type A, EGF and pentraxin domain-containing protein 1-like n=1 Tax=Argiope bruennichi TaxID=94029 RepID=UPI002494BFA8|nr:sushi, von Willebrand factor type A, EGF and pentraxin domain-containing protein 1-like [Argiope bruennichi]